MSKSKSAARSHAPSPVNRSSVRLNKFIADAGVCSRRKADELIADGKVTINGKRVFELGIKVDPQKDKVLVAGKPVQAAESLVYYMINKPKNVVTTMDDPLERPKVGDFIDREKRRLFPVGRLDWDSEGLLIMTNDGDFAQAVAHPKEEIPKTYLVKLNGQPDDHQLAKLKKGVTIIGGKVAAKHVERIQLGKSQKYDWIKIIITEGKNRQVRRMFEKIGYDVTKLQRVAIGALSIGKLKRGEYKQLGPKDLEKVFKPVDYYDGKPLAGKSDRTKKKIR
jgi:23S rRNA pseudouridine2605 synthase